MPMKRIVRLIIMLAVLLSLAGCDDKTFFPENTVMPPVMPFYGNAQVLEAPPELLLLYDGGSALAHLGTHSWNYDKGDGTWSGICVDALHPLDSQEYLQPVNAGSLYAEVQFADAPDSYTIRCWHESQWGSADAKAEEIAHYGNVFELKPGGYIYEVCATWEDDGGAYHGTAYYSLYVVTK